MRPLQGSRRSDLLEYGQDRSGVRFPVKFTSWGSGQDALYGYVLVPFVAAAGLTTFGVRLPMLLAGLATLPLMYASTRRIFGATVGLMGVFMLAISPWHILLSRWGLDCNLLPFVFLAGFTCLLAVRQNGWWFLPGCLILGLSLYAYGTAYVVVPVLILGATALMTRAKMLRTMQVWSGLLAFVLMALPIGLLLIVNTFSLNTIHIGPLTVPRLPVTPRWETITLLGAADLPSALLTNLKASAKLLLTKSDSLTYNVVEPYGIFYHLTLVLTIAGLVLVLRRGDLSLELQLLLWWLAAAASVGLLNPANINRLNILWIPMLMLGAHALEQAQFLHRAVKWLSILGLLAAFVMFNLAYHGAAHRDVANFKFQNGVIPALLRAQQQAPGKICVTDEINMPYIYALLTDPISPAAFQATAKFVDPSEPLRKVASFGRYVFGVSGCRGLEAATYVLRADDTPPRLGNRYSYEFFGNFVVYLPTQ